MGKINTKAGKEKPYVAFVSYSHADEYWAAWLQKSLERYRVPRRIRKIDPEIPARLNPVFRDKDELASSGNLSESIQNALDRSSALLVVCSPNAASSVWVNEEIKSFRRAHKTAPILCLMVDGSPHTDAHDCAFPPAVLLDDAGKALPEPLAADVRTLADGKRGALLKIVAGILGVGIDVLYQRDQHRRNRVAGVFIAVALAIALITSALAINAIRARTEADIRRAQAENLIDYMLVDLRAQLEPIGQLRILDSIGNEAMEYFSLLDTQGTHEDIYARAMALRQIGEVRFHRGKLEPARDAFRESRRLASALLESQPGNSELIFELGQAEFWVGYTWLEQGDLSRASDSMNRYRALSEKLNELEPDNFKYRMELSYSALNLAAIAKDQGRHTDALEYVEESVELWRKLNRDDSDNRVYKRELAAALSWMASIHTGMGDFSAAFQAYQESQDISKTIIQEYSRHAEDDRGLCDTTLLLAKQARFTGKLDYALEQYLYALDVCGALSESDLENTSWRESHARAVFGLGMATRDLSKFEESQRWLGNAFGMYRQIAEEYSLNVFLQSKYLLTSALLAKSALLNEDFYLALRGEERSRKIYESGPPASKKGVHETLELAMSLDSLGEIMAATGNTPKALRDWEEATRLLRVSDLGNALTKAAYVRLMHRLDRSSEVIKLDAEVRATGMKASEFLPALCAGCGPEPGFDSN